MATFNYTASDGTATASSSLTLSVFGTNDAPVANADTNWVKEDTNLTASGNVLTDAAHAGAPSGSFADVADTDVDVEGLTVTAVNGDAGNVGTAINGSYGILTLNANGTYSYTLYTAAQNLAAYNAVQARDTEDAPLTETFNYTASDGTATASSSLTLSVFGTNDAPTVGVASGIVSEEGLASANADGVGSADTTNSKTFSGSFTSGDVDGEPVSFAFTGGPAGLTSNAVPITWTVTATSITGAAGSVPILTATLTAAGAYTVTLNGPIDHPNPLLEDNLNLVFNVSATDGTATVPTTLTVTVEDDSGIALVPEDAALKNGASNTNLTFDLDTDLSVANNYGADGAGKVQFASYLETQSSGLTSNGTPIVYDVSSNGLILTATAGVGGPGVFVVTLDPSSGTYVIDMNGTVDSKTSVNFSSGQYNFEGGNLGWTGFVPLNEDLSSGTVIDNNSSDLLITPEVGGVHDGRINTTATAGGVSNGAVSGGNNIGGTPGGVVETLRVDFVTDLRGSPPSASYGTAANRNHIFDGHYDVNGSTAVFVSIQAASVVKIQAFDDTNDTPSINDIEVVGDGAPDPLTGIVIAYNGAEQFINLTAPLAPSYSVGGQTFTVVLNGDGSANVGGVVNNTLIGTYTAGTGYSSIEYSYVSGSEFQVGQFGASVPTTAPVSVHLPIELVDADGDSVTSTVDFTLVSPTSNLLDYSASVTAITGAAGTATAANPHIIGSSLNDVLTGDAADNMLLGGAGNDSLSGNAGNDSLIGGLGTDTLTGGAGGDYFHSGAGADTLHLNANDANLTGASGGDTARDVVYFDETAFLGVDTINDFVLGASGTSDVIDLSDLFTVDTAGGQSLSNYAQVTAGGQLQVDADGTVGGTSWTTIANISGASTGQVSILFDDTTHTTDQNGVA